jgi:hypothetical protein
MKFFPRFIFLPHDFMHSIAEKFFYTLLPFRGCECVSRLRWGTVAAR